MKMMKLYRVEISVDKLIEVWSEDKDEAIRRAMLDIEFETNVEVIGEEYEYENQK